MSALTLRGGLRLWTQFDYQGGQRKYDFTERLRCQIGRCRPLSVPDAPVSAKANASLAYLYEGYRYGYIEDASFLKWRELALEWAMPTAWAQWVHARSMLMSVAVRNLATWTPYPGLDPEGSRSQDNFVQVDYYTQPQVRYFVARLTMGL